MLNAVLCGVYGALASVSGKIALSSNRILESVSFYCASNLSSFGEHSCDGVVIACRLLSFGCMILLNAAMISSFLKSMENNSSVVVTVLSTASNYLLTGFAGKIVFNEPLGSWWVLGSTIICIGLCFIVISQEGMPKLRAK